MTNTIVSRKCPGENREKGGRKARERREKGGRNFAARVSNSKRLSDICQIECPISKKHGEIYLYYLMEHNN